MGIGAHSPYCHIGCNVPVLMLVDLVYFPVAIGGKNPLFMERRGSADAEF